MSSTVDKWRRFETWLATNFPEALADLNPGCNESLFDEAEGKLGIKLPDALKEVYRLHDGQRTTDLSAAGIFYGVCFLSLKQMVHIWAGWIATNDHIDKEGLRESLDKYQISFAPERLRAIYSSDRWIPFAIIAENSYLGLDFFPAADGVDGQVINFGRDEEQKTVLANSFEEFLGWYISELERGNFIIVNDDGWTEFLPKELSHRVLERRSPYLGAVAKRFIE